jgi:AAA domain
VKTDQSEGVLDVEKSYKVVQLTAENVKRLRAVEITPSGPVQVVAGKNAQGKSSVLDSIWLALDFENAAKTNRKVVRDGEDKATARVDLGDLVVTRTWKGENTALTVSASDGATYSRPQEMLDSLMGRLSFDPLAFTQQGDKEQVATLLGLVDLPFDPAELATDRARLYDSRRVVGQDLARVKGALESMPAPAPDAPTAEVSSSAIIAEMESAQSVLRQNDSARRVLESADAEAETTAESLRLATARHDTAKLAAAEAHLAVSKLPADPDIAVFSAKLATVEDANQAVRAARDYRARAAEAKTKQDEYDLLTKQIDGIDKQKSDALATVTFPIDGLGFSDDRVTFGGLPFRQASSAEKLRVSLAMAMAMNPQVRVIRITDGSLLDSEGMALVETMARDHDFQVWIERVDESGSVGVVIEDGQVKA